MARKSRKNSEQNRKSDTVFSVGIYARLSVEDKRDKKDSDTIETQINMLRDFVDGNRDMRLYGTYVDNGRTGTNFNRDGFNNMIEDLKAQKINCIVVKDLSRFARNAIEAGEYIERIFPFLGARFIAITDNYDNFNPGCSSSGLILPLKNMINELYAKDISGKIISVFDEKKKKGEVLGGRPPYGYMRDPKNKNKYIIDEYAAEVVRDIYNMRADGNGYNMIARKLNEKNIPTPSQHYIELGKRKKEPSCVLWQGQAIKKIVSNPAYIGHVVHGKTRRSLQDNIPVAKMPCEEWSVSENMHESLIDERQFYIVQEINQKAHDESLATHGKYPSTESIFMGLMYCGECGAKMKRYKNGGKHTVSYCFLCWTFETNRGIRGCSKKYVNENELTAAVYASILKQIKLAVDVKKLISQLECSPDYINKCQNLKKELDNIEKEINKNISLQNSLLSSYIDKLIDEAEYAELKNQYSEELAALNDSKAGIATEYDKYTTEYSEKNRWIAAFKQFENNKKLTREMLTALIDRIVVYEVNRIEIKWKYNDSFLVLNEYLKEANEK